MKKAELAKAIAGKAGITNVKANECLEALAIITGEQLAAGQEMILPGIGKLERVHKAARQGRNPRTGVVAAIPAKNTVKFKAASVLKDAVQ